MFMINAVLKKVVINRMSLNIQHRVLKLFLYHKFTTTSLCLPVPDCRCQLYIIKQYCVLGPYLFSNFLDPDPYSQYRSGSSQVKKHFSKT